MADMGTPLELLAAALTGLEADDTPAVPLRVCVGGWGARTLFQVWPDGTRARLCRLPDRTVAQRIAAAVNMAADRQTDRP